MQPTSRIQQSVTSGFERRLIGLACRHMPQRVTSDHLTIVGLVGAVIVVAGDLAERLDSRGLFLAVAGYVVHWFGASLDGSLARYRNASRPRYGYFLDHSIDTLCILMMVGGLGFTSAVRMDVALFVVAGAFALSIHLFLRNHVTGRLQPSLMGVGPTEMRMIFVAINLWIYAVGPAPGAGPLSAVDVVLLMMGVVFMTLFTVKTAAMILQLRAIEGNGRMKPSPAPEGRAPSPGRAAGPETSHESAFTSGELAPT